MIPTAATNPVNNQTSSSAMIGIASLILEGRALSDDNFIIDDSDDGEGGYSDSGINTGYNTKTSLSSSPCQLRTNTNLTVSSRETTDPTLQHFQRLRQKLGQLRQSSPSNSSWEYLSSEQGISISINDASLGVSTEGDVEDNDDGELDPLFIHHQKLSKQKSLSHGQIITNSGSGNNIGHGSSSGNDNNLLNTLQSLASTCLRHSTPRSFSKNRDWLVSNLVFSTPINSCNNSTNNSISEINSNCSGTSGNILTGINNINHYNVNISVHQQHKQHLMTKTMKKLNKSCEKKISPPKQGPHCDQFLKKVGLLKGEASEAEEHNCDIANLNEICYRWQIHCRQINNIMSRSDPICIEVYLGPENHEILLEQWIVQQIENPSKPTANMTLQSLCNAIRSQLYFSQITAWTDLIRKTKTYELLNNTRIKMPSKANGGLLKPRLNIFYRIKAYDSTACFISKPNIHNFPNISISENYTISVCLKSLPRLQGGLPKNNDLFTNSFCSTTSTSNPSSVIIAGTSDNDCLEHNHHNYFHNNLQKNQSHNNHHQTTSSTIIVYHLQNNLQSQHQNQQQQSQNQQQQNQQQQHQYQSQQQQESAIMLDDRLNLPCQEKGKHKCAFDEEEGSSDTVAESTSSEGLSHREKQLIKYKKRMLKRDKKSNKKVSEISSTSTASASMSTSSLFSSSKSTPFSNITINKSDCFQGLRFEKNQDAIKDNQYHQQYQQSQIQHNIDSELLITNGQHNQVQQQKKANEIRSINSIRPPLYQATSSVAEGIQTNPVEMISIGTQTSDVCMHSPSCKSCGNFMEFMCLNCNINDKLTVKLQPHSCNNSSNTNSGTNDEKNEMSVAVDNVASLSSENKKTQNKICKADLLLQAIQRTPQRNKNEQQDLRNNNSIDFHAPTTTKSGDCQLCKRQKIRHNYNDSEQQLQEQKQHYDQQRKQQNENSITNNTNHINKNQESLTKTTTNGHCLLPAVHVQMTKYQHKSSSGENCSKLNDKCDCIQPLTVCLENISNNTTNFTTTCNTNIVTNSSNYITNNVSNDSHNHNLATENSVMNEIISPLSSPLSSSSSTPSSSSPNSSTTMMTPQKTINLFLCDNKTSDNLPAIQRNHTLKPSLLKINNYTMKTSKSIPKINLTNIFCSPSSPIPISSGDSFNFDISPEIPVQKSNSAPTLPNSPSLSPRFLKQASIYKRRSRHLSDRSSERSSFGSDEQFSDEDLESVYSPATSPIKTKTFLRSNIFGRKPLLGSLEESLLQKRVVPKTQVSGFKVLLGASGGFCPTQLTIPASTYCYEFCGQAISTPYMCEIRLSRKGYTIPRIGTVQATLLNPLGTVVRMFVIPYDFRDMPPMHQTFIRQRILAVDDSVEKPVATNKITPNEISKALAKNEKLFSSSNSNNISNNNNNDSIVNNNNINDNKINNNNSNNNNNKNKNKNNNHNKNNNNSNTINNNLKASNSQPELKEISFGDQMRSLRYSIHLRFQTSRSGRLALHTDIKFLISRRTDCDTAAAHAKSSSLESPNELRTVTIIPENPKYSARHEYQNKI